MSRLLLSDIDGTLAHSRVALERGGARAVRVAGMDIVQCNAEGGSEGGMESEAPRELVPLPPSSTGQCAFVSARTYELCATLRRAGVRLAILTGARTGTLLQRAPALPAADAYAAENGGRIFYASAPGGETLLREDIEWRARMDAACGSAAEAALEPPERRSGELWQLYRRMAAEGWRLDAKGYSTSFRCSADKGGGERGAAALARLVEEVNAAQPRLLKASHNLGHADFYPVCSGKEGAAARMCEHFGVGRADASAMFDDENDLGMADFVGGLRLVVGCSCDAVTRVVEAAPQRFTTTLARDAAATEHMLRAALEWAGGGAAVAGMVGEQANS